MLAPLLLIATLIAAEPPLTAPEENASPEQQAARGRWYGGPAVLSDVAASTLLIAGLKSDRDLAPALIGLGLAGFALGGPINHFDHGQMGRAFGSLALRVASGAAGYGMVRLGDRCFSDSYDTSDACTLVMLSPLMFLAAMLIDDAVLAREPNAPPSPPARLALSPRLTIAPGLGALSLGGIF